MSLKVIYLDGFWDDILGAVSWYSDREPGLGKAVATEASSTIDRIIEAPLRFRTVYGQVRSLRTKRFPYTVLYLVEGSVIAFIGLKHGAQDMRRFVGVRLSDS